MRWVLAIAAFAVPPLLAIAFVKATSSPTDANVGGAFYLAVGLLVGIAGSVAVLSRRA